MSVKRKWFTRLTVSIISISMLLSVAACGDDEGGTATGDKVVIEYAGWDMKYVAFEMAEKYEAAHPNVDIVIHDNQGKWMGNEYTTQLAASDAMPDIINLENPDYPLKNDWVIDLKPYLDKEENLDIPQNYMDFCTFDGKVIMVPSSIFVNGVVVNKDLLAANNIEPPAYTWTIDEYMNIAKKTTKKGVSIGTNDSLAIPKHLPAQMNPELDWAAYNSTTKHLQLTPEWVAGASKSKELYDAGATLYEQLDTLGNPWDMEEGSAARTETEAARKELCTELVGFPDPAEAYLKGNVALWYEFSWGLAFESDPNYSGFAWDFYPFPTATPGQASRPGIVQDSRAITTSCENPDETWEFFKYMTFSPEGAADRLEIIKNYDQAAAKIKYPDWIETDLPVKMVDTSLPVSSNKQVLDDWIAYNQPPKGLEYIIGNLSTGYADAFKVVPGYDAAYEQGVQKAFKEQVLYGTAAPADIAADQEAKANAMLDEAYAAISPNAAVVDPSPAPESSESVASESVAS